MATFSFRQRAGLVDWRAITSVKADDIIVKSDTKQLQNVLDVVTFCEFRPDDVKNNSIESVCKMVNILQLISEYLLHCQEAQFKAIRDLQSKCNGNKETMSKMKKEILSLKEDRKIYQRQLAMLRKSLGPENLIGDRAVNLPTPKVTNLYETQNTNDKRAAALEQQQLNAHAIDAEVIKSVLRHEDESRNFMVTLLNDQRSTFMEQIVVITESLRATQQQQKENVSAMEARNMEVKMEHAVQKAIESMQRTVTETLTAVMQEQKKALSAASAVAASTAPAPAATSSTKSNDAQEHSFAELALQTAALEEFERELNARQVALDRKEREISHSASAARASLELSLAARRASDTERLDLLTTNESIALNALRMGARMILSTVKHALLRKKLRAFRLWGVLTQELRDVEVSNEQARLLVYAKDQRSVRENELQTQLELEKEKNVVSLAKQNNLLRQLDAAEAKVTELSAGTGRSTEREGDLQMLLTAEKERALVFSARLNTLKAKSDKEVAQLQERVAQLEEEVGEQRMEGNARPSRDSGMMTSMEFQPSLLTRSMNLGPTAGMLSVSTPGSRQHPGFGSASSMSLTDAYFSSGRQSHSQVPLSLRQSVQQRYLTAEGSEYDLFDRVQRRVASRKTNEEIEGEAMAALAAEIQARIASESRLMHSAGAH